MFAHLLAMDETKTQKKNLLNHQIDSYVDD